MPDLPEEAVQSAVHPDFKRILDERGGKVHGDSGPVMSCLREILTLHAEQIRADERRKVAEQIAAAIEAVDPVEWALAGQHAGHDAARIARQIGEARADG